MTEVFTSTKAELVSLINPFSPLALHWYYDIYVLFHVWLCNNDKMDKSLQLLLEFSNACEIKISGIDVYHSSTLTTLDNVDNLSHNVEMSLSQLFVHEYPYL